VNKSERTKWIALACIGGSIFILASIILIRLGETPPQHTLYFSAGYETGSSKPLFSIETRPAGYRVNSIRFDCHPTSAGSDQKASQFAVQPKDEFRCDQYLLELRERGDTPILTNKGFFGLSQPFVIGSGYPVGSQAGAVSRYVYRAPGVAVRHLITHPAADCNAAVSAGELCAENGGATGSMLLFPSGGGSVRMKHGETRLVSAGDTLWLGYIPFRLSFEKDGKATLRVVLNEGDQSWRTMRGERMWQGLDLPSWSLTAREPNVSSAVDNFVSEAARFGKGNLTEDRYEPEQEEQLQLLVDNELLCLESPTASPRDARVVWRPPYEPGCIDFGLATPQRVKRTPPEDAALRAYEQVQSEDRFGELMAQSARNLHDRVWEIDPTSNLFVFDYLYAAAPAGPTGSLELERVPVALLGVRPRITATRLHSVVRAFPHVISFRDASTSPALELQPAGSEPRLLLLLANRPNAAGAAAPMLVCTGSTFGQMQNPRPAALALGDVSLRPEGIWWSAAGSAGGNDCAELMRRGRDVMARSRGVAAARQPADGSAEIPIGGTAMPLAAGDFVRIGTLQFRYRAASDVAAFSSQGGGGRVYPFGADAVTLLGIGSLSNGVEGAMSPEMRTELAREAQVRHKASLPPRPIKLTIDGDIQRLLSRELAEAFEERTHGNAGSGTRAAAVVLDAENGAVLAVANAPGFDPWSNSRDEAILLGAMRGDVNGDDSFRGRIQNWAFLRHLAIGSTMKVATSIAMERDGMPLSSQDNPNGESCNQLLEISLANGQRIDHFKCTHNNPVLTHGSPDPAHWLPAFYGSCNVYFGGAAAMLVPGLGPGIFRSGPVATIPTTFDPAISLQPADLSPIKQRRDGNGFFETLLLLGYRFDFRDAKEASPQHVKKYRNLRYPTADAPWLDGLNVEGAFAYPTVPAPELFTNTFRGKNPQLHLSDIVVDDKVIRPQWTSQNWMPHYMALGWGQIMEGSALSIAVSGIPALNSAGQVRTPQIFASRVLPAPAPPLRAALLSPAQQAVLQTGFREVIANAGGTAHRELMDRRTAALAMGYEIGGKTGTIQLEKAPIQTTSADVIQRALWWGCGVIGFTFSETDWQTLRQLADQRKGSALANAYPHLPPRGFAAEDSACDSLNPGMPRVTAAALRNDAANEWHELPSMEWRATADREANSSAFLAAIWPAGNQTTAKRRLIVGITFDHDAAGAKRATNRIAGELVRLLATRGE
jgi:cell division protein FtsI/penicillin-binding protein 2